MLALKNLTSYAAERTVTMDKYGARSWVVAVRATYHVNRDGTLELAGEQKPPLYSPEYIGEPGISSIRYEADLIPTKPATDVTLNGHAIVPAGKPLRTMDVSMRVGPLNKRLRVFGERRWERGLAHRLCPSAPALFERMPLTYERAFGGWDRTRQEPSKQRLYPTNPIGTGFGVSADRAEGQALPNIEDPSQPLREWDAHPPPGGFGAIASYWAPRLARGGTYDDAWMKRKFPLLPDDFDDRFYQSAPPDQQVNQRLFGGEEVELVNLTESGRLCFKLPRVYLAFTTRFGRRSEEHRASLQSVILEPDASRLIMVWQTSLACHSLLDELDVTLIREKRYV